MPQPELFGAVFALAVATAYFLTQRGRLKITGGKRPFVRVGNLLIELQKIFAAVFALAVAAAHFLTQRGRLKITGGKRHFVRVSNLLVDLQNIFGAVFAQVVAAAHLLTQLGKRTPPTDDDDGPGWQLMPPGTPAGRR